MILLFTVMLTLISMITVVLTEAYFIPYQNHDLKPEPFRRFSFKFNILGIVNDWIRKWEFLFFERAHIQNCDETNSEGSFEEIDLKIYTLKKNLQQNLDTLNYLFKMESNFKTSEAENQKLQIHSLRGILRKRVSEITKELLHYRTLKTKNLMVDYEEVN